MSAPACFRSSARPWAIALATVAWAAVIAAGFGALVEYELTPGANPAAPSQWPVAAAIALDPRVPTLVLFAHPQCPCSRATIAELEKIAAECHGQVALSVLFYAPESEGPEWPRSDLWRRAAAIPGVSVGTDLEGRTALRFGAATSGQALLFNPAGRMLFSGGITGARGHEGDNPGRQTVVSAILGRAAPAPRATAVFGCSLQEEPTPPPQS